MTQHPMNKARYYDINNRIHYTTRCQTITSDNEIRDDKIRSDRTVVQESMLDVKVCKIYNNMEDNNITAELFNANEEFNKLDKMYDECLSYLKDANEINGKYKSIITEDNNNLENIKDENLNGIRKDLNSDVIIINMSDITEDPIINCIINKNSRDFPILENGIIEEDDNENKIKKESIDYEGPIKSERLRRLSEQLPRIIITQSNTSLDVESEKPNKKPKSEEHIPIFDVNKNHISGKINKSASTSRSSSYRYRSPYIDYPKRMVSKLGVENVALISNVPYGKLRLLNDTFHTLINLRWRWIVTGTVVVHFAIWLVFAVFWYLASLAHYDFDPDPPLKACVTGGKDFVTIFLASVEAQTTIGFGDRTIDEECPESIFLFIMQLILGTGLSGVLTCVVYAKLTRPEKLSRDGVGFSKKAVVCMRDGKLCLMLRAWDLNYDHLISSDFNAHFVKTKRTKEGEYIRYYASSLELQQSQFLLWPVTIVHIIDENSPLFNMTPENFINSNYEITVSLKGASASMGTFTQSQTSYLPREVLWGYRFPSVVKYNHRKRKYVIDYKKLDLIEQIDTPLCSASQLYSSILEENEDSTPPWAPGTPSSFSDKISSFKQERTSSFRRKHH